MEGRKILRYEPRRGIAFPRGIESRIVYGKIKKEDEKLFVELGPGNSFASLNKINGIDPSTTIATADLF